jgi:nucleoside-diphosphate-sugar epimerase
MRGRTASISPRSFTGFGNAARITRLPVKIEALDLLDLPRVQAALSGFDAVINCTRGDSSLMTRGLRNLGRAAEHNRVRKFIHLSSVTIYGEIRPGQRARGPRAHSVQQPLRRTETSKALAGRDVVIAFASSRGSVDHSVSGEHRWVRIRS